MTTFKQVQQLLVNEWGLAENEVQPGTRFADLGFGEEDRAELLLALEEEFEIELPEDTSEQFETVQELVTFLDSLAGQPGGAGSPG